MQEIEKLKQLRTLSLPDDLLREVPPRIVSHLRTRAAHEPPRELRRRPPEVRYTLLVALCWQRSQEITDNLVELLVHIAHRVNVRAEEKVEVELLKHLKRVAGKGRLLYTLAKAAKGAPEGVVKDVIFPAVGEHLLDDVIREAEVRLESLGREIHEGLNVIETWNGANDFILYGKGGEFASNRLEDQEVLMLSLHLLQICLVYVNTLMIQQVLAQPEWQGRLTAEELRALSPLKWQHVNPYGTFTLNMSQRLPLDAA